MLDEEKNYYKFSLGYIIGCILYIIPVWFKIRYKFEQNIVTVLS